ncbi:restriction endonuclease subunit S [Castellaniella sp.]|uniref:restriction endonuclease subunit S n=1 Tax=Castellaniella sp. TaxID=1955812 RepID=UPI002AFF52A7|nr:restriction endonuclease subunit S [Castellaniella sp.]
MSSELPVVRLGDHVDSCLGKMLDAKKNKGSYQPYLGNSNVRWGNFDLVDLAEMKFEPSEEARYSLEPGDLVVCEGGEPGRCAIWTGAAGMKIQKALHRIRPKETLNNYYLFYWFLCAAKAGLLEPYFTGTTIKHLTGKAVAALELPLPPMPTQVAVVDVLKPLDDRITLLRETNKTLESIAQAIFKSWFVDFDPVRAKMEGRQPEGMDEETAALFPDSFEESELGLIPREWQKKSLDAVASYLNGLALQKFPPTGENDLPVIKIAQLRKGDTNGADLASGAIKPEYIVRDGDVLFSWSGSLEVEVWCGGIGALNQHLFKVTSNEYPKWFYFLWTKHHLPSFRQIAAGKATTMGHIQRKHLSSAAAMVPPANLMGEASKVFMPLIDLQIENSLQVRSLSVIRDTLLPRLVSGQLPISDRSLDAAAISD